MQFKEYFENAIRIHLRSDVPVGSALSGGLDSSAIVCVLNRMLNREAVQKTFSSCSHYEKYDERKWMDIVVNHTAIEAHYYYPDIAHLFDMTSQILWHQDEPYQSHSAYLGYNIFRLAKEEEVKVLLNGQGADEYLGGYGQFNKAIFFELFKKLNWKLLYQEVINTPSSNFYNTVSNIGYLLMPEEFRNIITRYFSSVSRIKNLIDIENLGALNRHPYYSLSSDLANIQGIIKLNLFHNPLTKYLRWEDRNSMAHSIEARVPFLDHRLVEFAFNLPAEYLVSKGVTKRIMRNGLQNILPPQIANRRDKKGFITPEEHWIKNGQSNFFRKKLHHAIKSSEGIIKSEALNYYDNIVKGDMPFDYTYYRLILFSEWLSYLL